VTNLGKQILFGLNSRVNPPLKLDILQKLFYLRKED